MERREIIDKFLSAIVHRKWKFVRLQLEGGLVLLSHVHLALLVSCTVTTGGKGEKNLLFLIQFLLDQGANPNHYDTKGRTAIMLALKYHLPKSIIQLLLQYGADLNMCDYNGKNALSYLKTKYWPVYKTCFESCNLSWMDERGRKISRGIQTASTFDKLPATETRAYSEKKVGNEFANGYLAENKCVKSSMVLLRKRRRPLLKQVQQQHLESIFEAGEDIEFDNRTQNNTVKGQIDGSHQETAEFHRYVLLRPCQLQNGYKYRTALLNGELLDQKDDRLKDFKNDAQKSCIFPPIYKNCEMSKFSI